MQCKSYSHFFSKKFQHICVSLIVNFNESLTNDVVSFEQLGPDTFLGTPTYNFQPIRLLDPDCCYKFTYLMVIGADPDQLIWIYTVCKCRLYPGSAGQGLSLSYGLVNTVMVMLNQSVNLLTHFLGRLSPLSGQLHVVLMHILLSVTDNCP